MRFGVLGPFEVTDDGGRPVEVGGHRLRALLAMLVLDAGRPVGVDRLTDGLWGDAPPADAANALQSLVSRLRSALEPARATGSTGRLVESGPGGYRLAVGPDSTDAHRFTQLAVAGRRQLAGADAGAAFDTLGAALALWRGPALAGLTDAPFAPAAAARLAEARLAAAEDHADAALAAGRHAEVVADLEELADAHPLRERLRGLLVRTLYASGRQADALGAYQRTQQALAEELGVDPSPELRAVQLAVLRQDPALTDRRVAPPRTGPAPGAAPDPLLDGRPGTVAGTAAGAVAGTSSDIRPVAGSSRPDGTPGDDSGGGRGGRHGGGSDRATGPGQDRPATNLRAQLTSFVGRDADVARIGTLLTESRLVTLVGPGGAGKTRLATESAARLHAPPPDGVWLVELAPVADPADVVHAVVDVLGVRETSLAGRRDPVPVALSDPVGGLVGALAGRRLLIVLDNCEHLVDAAAALADRLLGDCPGVRILATSREPLGITGEARYPVPSLAGPPEDTDPVEALGYPAVRLLADRGAAVRPDFTVRDGNVAAVVRICRRLDGMPLAIELAAARLRALPPEQVAARLDDRFRLLTAGSRTVLPRHQTLRAVVEWSWDLLDKRERVLARRLSAFPAGATLEAAEQVCAGGDLAAADVFEVLAALVDKSLVEADTDPDTDPEFDADPHAGTGASCPAIQPGRDTAPRYRMLETVRAYAAERLVESGESGEVRRAHARYFLDLAETADARLRGRDQLTWVRRLVAEQDNLHAAMRWAVDTPDPDLAVRMVSALAWFWALRGYDSEAVNWARQVYAAVRDAPPPGRLAEYVGCMMGARIDPADPMGFLPAIEEGLGMLADAGVPEPRSPLFLMVRIFAAMLAGRDTELATMFDDWLADPDPWMRCFALSARGAIRVNQGDPAGAAADLEAALSGCRQVGDRWSTYQCLTHLAELAGLQGDNARVVELMDEAGRYAAELGASVEAAELVLRRAGARMRAGDLAGAESDLAEARQWAERWPQPHLRALLLMVEGDLAWRHGRVAEAESRYEQAQRAMPADHGAPQIHALAGCTRARVALARGDLPRARGFVLDALAVPRLLIDRPVTASVLEALGSVELVAGDAERAAVLFGAAEGVRGAADLGNPEVRAAVAAARRALGDRAYALAHQRGTALDCRELSAFVGVDLEQLTPSAGR